MHQQKLQAALTHPCPAHSVIDRPPRQACCDGAAGRGLFLWHLLEDRRRNAPGRAFEKAAAGRFGLRYWDVRRAWWRPAAVQRPKLPPPNGTKMLGDAGQHEIVLHGVGLCPSGRHWHFYLHL